MRTRGGRDETANRGRGGVWLGQISRPGATGHARGVEPQHATVDIRAGGTFDHDPSRFHTPNPDRRSGRPPSVRQPGLRDGESGQRRAGERAPCGCLRARGFHRRGIRRDDTGLVATLGDSVRQCSRSTYDGHPLTVTELRALEDVAQGDGVHGIVMTAMPQTRWRRRQITRSCPHASFRRDSVTSTFMTESFSLPLRAYSRSSRSCESTSSKPTRCAGATKRASRRRLRYTTSSTPSGVAICSRVSIRKRKTRRSGGVVRLPHRPAD